MSLFGNSKSTSPKLTRIQNINNKRNLLTQNLDSSGGGGIFGNSGGGGGGIFGNSGNNGGGGGGGIFGNSGNNNGGGGGGGIFGNSGGNNNNGGGGIFGNSGGGNNNNNSGGGINNMFGGNSNASQFFVGCKNSNIREDYKKDINVSTPDHLPKDTVQCIKWCKNENLKIFATGDWAGDFKIYKFDVNGTSFSLNMVKSENMKSPIFSIEWSEDSSLIFIALSNGIVKAMQLQSGNVVDVAKHEGMTSMEAGSFQNKQIIITMGTDKRILIWSPGNNNPLAKIDLRVMPLASDFSSPFLAIACTHYVVAIVNFETLGQGEIVYYTQCNLKSPLVSIALRPMSRRFACGSVDGRVCITDFEFGYKNDGQIKTADHILFRAHRNEKKGNPEKSHLYQVNAVGFHSKFKNFLFTSGGNSITYFWDCIKKSQSAEFHYGGLSVTAAAVSPCGNLFAYALGYDWSYGVWGTARVDFRPLICVHVNQSGDITKN